MPIGELVFLAAVWALFGGVAYFFSQNPYKWPKKWGILFALGGPITALGAMYDVWTHTSMRGAYTRDWKNDPENGVYVVPLKDLKNYEVVNREEKT